MVAAAPAFYAPVDMARRRKPANRADPTPGTLGYYVRFRREVELDISQQELADRIVDLGGKMKQGDISDLELSDKLPRPENMRLIAQALEVAIGKLYTEAGHPDLASDYERHAEQTAAFEILPPGPEGEILALVRRKPEDQQRRALEILRVVFADDASKN